MRRTLVFASISLFALLAGCGSTPSSETPGAETAATPEPSTPAETPSAPETAAAPETTAPAETPAQPAAAAPSVQAGAPALQTDEQRTIYAIGLNMGRQLGQLSLTPEEAQFVARGILDQVSGKPAVDLQVWGPKINELAMGREAKIAAREKENGKKYLADAAKKVGAVKTASGLVYRELKAGNGNSPTASSTVRAHYRGTLTNGTEFDSSYKRNQPLEIPLSGVVPCWTEGIQKMKVGGKAELVCPSDIAYGDEGRPPTIPGGATLVFEVELLGIL